MAVRLHLAVILSADEALHDLSNFAFVVLHLLSTGGRYLSAAAELLHLIGSLEELHTEV